MASPLTTHNYAFATKEDIAMFGLVFGAITGGLIIWCWGDRIRQFAADNMTGARKSTADRLRSLADTTEGAPNQAEEPARRARAN